MGGKLPTAARDLVAGVDLSTKEIHMVRRRQGTTIAEARQIKLESFAKYAERDALAARAAALAIQNEPEWWDRVWLCGVEYPFTNARFIGSVVLKTMLGAVVASIPEHVHVIPLPAQLWTPEFLRPHPDAPKPKVPPKKEQRKPLIAARARELLGMDESDKWPQDVFDAFGMSWAVEALNRPATLPATPPRPGVRVPV